MKKILCLMLLLALLLPTVAGCGSTTANTTVSDTTAGTTPETTQGADLPTVTTPAETTPKTPEVDLPEGERLVKHSYTAVLNDEVWTDTSVDSSSFTMSGTGVDIYQTVNREYKDYTRHFVIVENETETTYTGTKAFPVLKKLGICGANVTLDEIAKTATIKVIPVALKLLSSWKAVAAKEGSYVRFDFTTNMELDYAVTVTQKEGDAAASSVYTQDDITVKGSNGKYTGVARCTVPYAQGKTYYINICLGDSYTVLASVPLHITTGDYHTGFELVFVGDWDVVKDETYFDKFNDIFQNFYPQVYTRWAVRGDEPKVVKLRADKTYTGVAYQLGGQITVGVDYLNGQPDRLTIIGHEGTHVVEQYSGKLSYGGESTYTDPVTGEKKTAKNWWTENLANYGCIRYCQYSYSLRTVHGQVLDVNTNSSLWDWGYGSYADGGKMFIAWLDWRYPTTDKNGDGKITRDEYGVVDLVNYTIKTHGEWFYDNPYDPTSPFNKAFYTASGGAFKTADEARLIYAAECESGAYTFKGFAEYKDNFLTDNIPGVTANNKFMSEPAVPTGKTNPILSAAVTTGNNLCVGAMVDRVGEYGMNNNVQGNLIDGDLTTRYQAARFADLYKFNGMSNIITIDLGEVKTFDTYTLVSYAANESCITKSWEILVSTNGVNFTAVDYQKDNTQGIVSVTFEEVSARYVEIRLYEPDSKGAGITRLCEFMLFDTKK